MGGRIEEEIFKLCDFEKLSVREVFDRIVGESEFDDRKYGTFDKHMRKMYRVQQLKRESGPEGVYVYWNSRTIGKPGQPNP